MPRINSNLLEHGVHVCIEPCTRTRFFDYLCKYITKTEVSLKLAKYDGI